MSDRVAELVSALEELERIRLQELTLQRQREEARERVRLAQRQLALEHAKEKASGRHAAGGSRGVA